MVELVGRCPPIAYVVCSILCVRSSLSFGVVFKLLVLCVFDLHCVRYCGLIGLYCWFMYGRMEVLTLGLCCVLNSGFMYVHRVLHTMGKRLVYVYIIVVISICVSCVDFLVFTG